MERISKLRINSNSQDPFKKEDYHIERRLLKGKKGRAQRGEGVTIIKSRNLKPKKGDRTWTEKEGKKTAAR